MCYKLPTTTANIAQWRRLKSTFSAAPYCFNITASYMTHTQQYYLNDQLEPDQPYGRDDGPIYILEPYWSDIVTILETEDICPIHKYSGVVKRGNPPRYHMRDCPLRYLQGTTDQNEVSLLDFRPCRSLMCPGAHVDKIRKCSRCGQASYCSKDCQKQHWPLHKQQCKTRHDIKR